MSALPKPARERSSSYLAFVRQQPCCLPTSLFPHACSTCPGQIEAHHVSPRNGTKSAASKVSDRRAVPVCWNAHRYCEQRPLEVWAHLNVVIYDLNRKFDATHEQPRKRQPRMKVGLAVKDCEACHGDHFYESSLSLLGQIQEFKGFRCKARNVWVSI